MKKKQKIVLVATTDLNFDQRLIKISSSLVEMGFEVELVGRELPTSPPLNARKYNQHRLKCFFHKGALFYAEFNIRVFFYLLFHSSFDFINSNDLDSVLGCYFGTLFKKCTRVFDAHEYFTEVPELHNSFKKKIWKWIELTFVPRFDRHYTVCHSLSEIFEQRTGKKHEVIRNMPVLEINDFDAIEKSEKFILYQGAVNEGRGLEQLVDCMIDLPYILKIAGDGDVLQKLKDQVIELQLEEKVIFLGKLLPNDLRKLTLQAHVGILLLDEKNIHYYLSLANKFFEYTHAHVPFLAMNFPEYLKAQENCQVALGIDSLEDKEAMKLAIHQLFQDKDLYKQLQSNCAILKQALNWQMEQEKLREIYK